MNTMDVIDTRREARFESMYRKSRSAQLWRRHKELEDLCVKKIREHELYTHRAIVDISRQQIATMIRVQRLERAKALTTKRTSGTKSICPEQELKLPALPMHAGNAAPQGAMVASGDSGTFMASHGDVERRRRLAEWVNDSRYMFSVSSRQGRDTYFVLNDGARP